MSITRTLMAPLSSRGCNLLNLPPLTPILFDQSIRASGPMCRRYNLENALAVRSRLPEQARLHPSRSRPYPLVERVSDRPACNHATDALNRGICRLMRSNIVSVLKQLGLRLDNYFNRVVLAVPMVLFRPQKRKPDRPVLIRHPNIHEINIKRRCL